MEIIQQRFYGQPKIKKPKFLHSKTQIGTALFLRRCACKIYEHGGFVYVHHKDWFSSCISKEEAVQKGIIDKYNRKFVYNDNFGSVVLRNECIFRFEKPGTKEFMLNNRIKLIKELAEMIGAEWTELSCWEWEDFFEQVLDIIKNNGWLMPVVVEKCKKCGKIKKEN